MVTIVRVVSILVNFRGIGSCVGILFMFRAALLGTRLLPGRGRQMGHGCSWCVQALRGPGCVEHDLLVLWVCTLVSCPLPRFRYIFLEYASPAHALDAVKNADGYKLDKQHTFRVNLFTDFDK